MLLRVRLPTCTVSIVQAFSYVHTYIGESTESESILADLKI